MLGGFTLIRKFPIMFALLIVLVRYGAYWAFFDTSQLPKGDLIAEVESSHGTYTIKCMP
ncbi:DUF5412 family protein [Saccharococcus thermophilus]|uniref:DUF5412 family protein n=1 Tax=Saccharococcus thermophilus TaxID=29396 RepID=UPI00361E6DBD